MTPRALTPRQEQFATGVASGLSQSEAFRQAYPRSKSWTDRTVWSHASRLAADGRVSARIADLSSKAAAANELTVAKVVRELMHIAFGDRRDLMTWGPDGVRLKPSSDLTPDQAAAVAEVSESVTKDGGSIKLKTHDKVKALELLGKHLGIFVEKTEITGRDGEPLLPTIYMPSNGRDGA